MVSGDGIHTTSYYGRDGVRYLASSGEMFRGTVPKLALNAPDAKIVNHGIETT